MFEKEPVIQNWLKNPSLIEGILNGFKEVMEFLTECEDLKDYAIILSHKNLILMCLVNKDLQGN